MAQRGQRGIVIVEAPDVELHDDPTRVIGRRTRYHGSEHPYLRGHDVVIVAVLKDALRGGEHRPLTSDEELQRAGGVSAADRVEVAPVLPDEGHLSFVTSDPRAVDLACFAQVAGARRQTVPTRATRRTLH